MNVRVYISKRLKFHHENFHFTEIQCGSTSKSCNLIIKLCKKENKTLTKAAKMKRFVPAEKVNF